ncbi:MAG: Gfo/Idh/MocA family oxidoreductase [Proteobacteria bacterium]|nr:Gfo/Idh/MocA family oxidoreductase [Pseudomonadota bacterium]MBI3496440.1 Gfo/Idh/MocA family oxidoreductase [Pseudomonadota bacterium]
MTEREVEARRWPISHRWPRIAVIGAGLMGRRHGHAYRSIPGVELIGFVDHDPAAQAEVRQIFGLPCHSHWDELFAADGLDAVSICLPDDQHLPASLAALERGLAVLLEKPLATDVREAERIVAASQDRLLLVGHMLRFDARYQQARRLLAAGRIGDLVHLTTRRNSAIGAASRYGKRTSLLWHVAVHDIDLVQWITGRPIVEVTAKGVSRRLAPLQHLDSVLALATLGDDTPVAMEFSWIMPEHFGSGLDARLEVVGTEGRIEVHGLDQGLRVADRTSLEFPDTTRWVDYDDGSAGGILVAEIAHFVRCLVEGITPGVAVADALQAVKVAAALERSLAEGRTVVV